MTLQLAIYVGSALPFFAALAAIIFLFVRDAVSVSPRANVSEKLSVRVVEVREEAYGIKSFRLEPISDIKLPKASPGSHVDVCLEKGLVRQYSICNFADAPDHYRIAVKLEENSRGGSRAMHALQPGDLLEIGEPHNNFELVESAEKYLLFAGGIGITPVLAMVRGLERRGAEYHLHYFTRSPQHTAFQSELSAACFAGRVSFHYAIQPEALRPVLQGLVGSSQGGNIHLYVCGPRPFMEAVEEAAAGLPRDCIHRENFSADQAALAAPRQEFEVELARSGKRLHVPADASLLDVLNCNGIYVEHSCQEGICGTCLTRVLEGEPDHRDGFLTAAERSSGNRMLVCVSRAKTAKLVLEL